MDDYEELEVEEEDDEDLDYLENYFDESEEDEPEEWGPMEWYKYYRDQELERSGFWEEFMKKEHHNNEQV